MIFTEKYSQQIFSSQTMTEIQIRDYKSYSKKNFSYIIFSSLNVPSDKHLLKFLKCNSLLNALLHKSASTFILDGMYLAFNSMLNLAKTN